MTIRTRLLIGYGYLVSLTVVVAVVSALGLQRFARDVGRVVDASGARLERGLSLLRALQAERATASRALARGLEDGVRGGLALPGAEHRTDDALAAVVSAAAAGHERELADRLTNELRSVRTRRRAALGGRAAATPAAAIELNQLATGVEARATELLRAGHERTLTAERAARDDALGWAVLLGALVALALLSVGFISRGLQRSVLARLAELAEVAEDQAAGDRARRMRVRGEDELATIARQLNEALDRQQAVRAQAEGRVAQGQQLVVAQLEAGPPAALVGLDGVIVATTLPERERARLAALAPAVEALRGPLPEVGEERWLPADGASGFALRLLRAGGRPIAWLATAAAREPRPAAPPATPAPPAILLPSPPPAPPAPEPAPTAGSSPPPVAPAPSPPATPAEPAANATGGPAPKAAPAPPAILLGDRPATGPAPPA